MGWQKRSPKQKKSGCGILSIFRGLIQILCLIFSFAVLSYSLKPATRQKTEIEAIEIILITKTSAMNYEYGIPAPLLRFLGACVFGDAGSYYAGLGEAERAGLEKQGKSFGMTTWFYRYLYEVLPKEKLAEYQKIYQARQIKAMMGGQELKRLYQVLASHDLRFVPIKGADLACRLYPDAALRPYGDWDIWFHPDDCDRALAVLAEDGWTVPDLYSNDHEEVRKTARHHFSPHVRGTYMLEPHFSLSNFDGVDLYEMWEHTVEYPDGDGQRVLSPEMNLLMLARHASSQSYYHAQIPKLLADAAMVMQKENVDFTALRELANSWHMPYPGNLLAAFPEFFGTEAIESFGADPAKSDGFRKLFELRGTLGEPESISLVLSRYEVKGMAAGGILKHIRAHNTSRMRRMYHLPEHGAWGRVAWAYVCWFWTRSLGASQWLLRKPRLRNYAKSVEYVECTNDK